MTDRDFPRQGRRPERTLALNFLSTFRQRPGGELWTAMPQFFKLHGYFTSSAGKVTTMTPLLHLHFPNEVLCMLPHRCVC